VSEKLACHVRTMTINDAGRDDSHGSFPALESLAMRNQSQPARGLRPLPQTVRSNSPEMANVELSWPFLCRHLAEYFYGSHELAATAISIAATAITMAATRTILAIEYGAEPVTRVASWPQITIR
jgi:hypothetical protein